MAPPGDHGLQAVLAAGLAAGPEAHVASRIVARALLGGGDEISDYAIKKEISKWLREHPRKGR